MTPVSCLLLGCGSIGLRHLRNLKAIGGVALSAFDPDRARLAEAAKLGDVAPEIDLEAALAGGPKLALICTPPHLHVPLARKALSAGAHLFLEKPLAHTLEGVDDLLAAAKAQGRLVAVGYNLRFHAGLRRVKELLDGGAVGRPLFIRAEFGQYLPDWRPNRDYRDGYNAHAATGGGILLDASHEIDYVRWLAGEVESVTCVARRLGALEIDVEDTAALILQLAGGRIAEIHLDSLQRTYARGCKVVGTEGVVIWDWHGGVRWRRAGDDTWCEERICPDANEMYVDEMRDLLAAVREGRPPSVDGADGRRTLAVALAARASSDEAREVRP